jgi:hypothetical protein
MIGVSWARIQHELARGHSKHAKFAVFHNTDRLDPRDA